MRNSLRSASASMMALAALSGFNFEQTPQPGSPAEVVAKAESGRVANPSALANALRIQQTMLQQTGYGYVRAPRKPRNPGPGWSNRHVQRMARKKRNVKANRRAHRG